MSESTVVAEPEAQTTVPPVESSSSAPPQEPPREPEAAPAVTPEPVRVALKTEAEYLQSAAEKKRRVYAGEDAPELALLPKEQRAWDRWQQSEADRARADEQGRENYQKHVTELATQHDTVRTTLLADFTELLSEQNVELTVSQAKLLDQTLDKKLSGLRDNAHEIVLRPIERQERARLAGTLVTNGLMAPAEAQRFVARLPLVGETEKHDSVMFRLFQAGIEVGKRQGGGLDQVVMSKKDFDAAIVKAREEGADSVKATGGPAPPSGGGTGGADGALTLARYDAMSYEERTELRRKNPDAIDAMSARGR